jgi:signal transduction histidine kinase
MDWLATGGPGGSSGALEHHRHEREGGERGAGIGLYLARQIVAAHGGAIRCEAGATGVGACFAIELPVQGDGGRRATEGRA